MFRAELDLNKINLSKPTQILDHSDFLPILKNFKKKSIFNLF